MLGITNIPALDRWLTPGVVEENVVKAALTTSSSGPGMPSLELGEYKRWRAVQRHFLLHVTWLLKHSSPVLLNIFILQC